MKIKNSDTRFSLLDRCGNSIIEVMVVIVVVTTGIVGSYQIAFRGNSMSASTEDRIKAINIARE
jgi:Tfp pilus assembly protein PilV